MSGACARSSGCSVCPGNARRDPDAGCRPHWVGTGRVALRYVSPWPGSRAGLLPPSPLRTARESFLSSSSSLANAPCGTRSCHESGTTFTIRAWSLHTVIRSESAPVSVATAVICFLSLRGWPRSRVMQDQTDVSSLARGVILRVLNSYPPHYRVAFASSILPFPHIYRLALRLAFPHGRRTGLPCSVSVTTNGLGALYPPVA